MEESKIYFKKKLNQVNMTESTKLPSLTEEQIKEIRKKLKDNAYLLTLFELDLNIGLRASEFKYIKAKVGKFENVDDALKKDIWLDLREGKGKMLLYRQKRKYYHLIALTADICELIKRQLRLRKSYGITHDYLFFSVTGKILNKNLVHSNYRKLSKIAGIKVTSHRLRRTMNTLLELKQMPRTVRRERLGHAPETQTDIYSVMDLNTRRMHLETIEML
jgi:site-specific recombinase XerC